MSGPALNLDGHRIRVWLAETTDGGTSNQRLEVSAFSDLGDAQHVLDGDGPERGGAEGVERLVTEVESLPDDYREVVMLYYYGDLTYRDLADMLGVSAATVNEVGFFYLLLLLLHTYI